MQPHQLESKLKALRLSGMLETLEHRLEQAQRQQHGYITFLEWLLEDEIGRRAQKALSLRFKRARFDQMHTLAEFDFGYNPKLPVEAIRDLAGCRFIERNESALIIGPVGVGKSHVAQAIGHAACRKGYSVRYIKTARLLSDLGGGHADGTWEQRLRSYMLPDLLILDDFGRAPRGA